MTNLFLKINKDLFKLDFNPTEMMIISQVLEYQTKNLPCYMSNEQFADNFHVSASTISRAVNRLAAEGYMTITSPKSKSRTLYVNVERIETQLKQIAEVKSAETEKPKQIDEVNLSKMPKLPKQNDSVKDNEKIIKKDNSSDETISDCLHPHLRDCMSASSKEEFESCW